jgi:hypothetical protein
MTRPTFDRPEDKIRQEHARALERLAADDSLTAKAKTVRVAAIHRETLAKLAESTEQESQKREQQLARHRRTAWGIDDLIGSSSDGRALMDSHRSALERADAIEDLPRARAALQRANEVGDEVMARAIGRKAWTMLWTPVLEQYASTRPKAAEAIEALSEVSALPRGGAELFRSVLATPPELVSKITRQAADASQLERLANGEDVPGFGS